MHTGNRRTQKSILTSALALATAGILLPASAFAEDTGPISPMAPWQECLQGAAPAGQNIAPGEMDTEPNHDEVILDFDDSLSHNTILGWAGAQGLHVELNSPAADAPNVYIARVAEGAVPYVKACLAKRGADGDIEAIEENFEYKLFAEGFEVARDADSSSTKPNDPLYQFQWHFDQVNAEEAWKTSTGRDVVVAVIDTGVAVKDDANRGIKAAKDLAGTSIVDGYDFVDKSDFVFDGHGHGTHVAGTIAQTTNNKYGVAGLAYNAKIMGLRVLNSRGFGQVADIADAVRFAADNGAQVINMSLGGPLPSLVLKKAIDHAHKKGVTVVAAAGNGGRRAPSYPAAYDHTIAVAATQYDKNTTFYSQWGKFVDIAAPGGNTRVDQNGDDRPDGVMQQTLKPGSLDQHDFLLYMGTSMASPHVAAGAAMVISQGVTHPDKVEAVLKKTSDASLRDRYSSDKEFHERYGAGLMQVDQAVKAAELGQGSTRTLAGLLLALFAAGMIRRRDPLGLAIENRGMLAATSAVIAGGFFFLPTLIGESTLTYILARPLAEMDILVFGLGTHQSPLFASALIPLAAYGLLGGKGKLRTLACGIALGMAGFLFTESIILTSDVRLIPGMDMLDRVWLAGNGLISLAIGYFGLKRY